jgi:hypothetical protein
MEKQTKKTREQYIRNELKIRTDSLGNGYGVPELKAELKGIKEGRTQAISEFKEKIEEMEEEIYSKYDIVDGELDIRTLPQLDRNRLRLLEELKARLNKTAQEMKA